MLNTANIGPAINRYSPAAFRNGGLVNYQLQYSRSRTALPITRDYMAEGEKALG